MHMGTSHLEAALSRRARAHPPGKASLAIARLSLPSAVSLEGLAAALALRAAGRRGQPRAAGADGGRVASP